MFPGKLAASQRKPYVTFACSVIGASHIKSAKPCQDASLCEKGKKYRFIAVADGHGGDPYFRSELGSRFAVEALRSCVFDSSAANALNKMSANADNNKTEKEREHIILQIKKYNQQTAWTIVLPEPKSYTIFTG